MIITTESVATREEQRVIHRLTIETAEPVTYGYRVKRQWIPDRAVVTWERCRYDAEPWEPWVAMYVKVYGRNVLASGAMGADHAVRLLTGPDADDHDGLGSVWAAAMRTVPGDDLPTPRDIREDQAIDTPVRPRTPIRPRSVGGTE